MFWIITTFGLFVRSLFIIKNWKDPIWILGALLVSITIFFASSNKAGINTITALDYPNLYIIPLIYLMIIVYIYQDRILPIVTESLLFFQSLIALFIFYKFFHVYIDSYSIAAIILLFLLVVYVILTIAICYLDFQIKRSQQTFLVLIFLLINLYISYETLSVFLSDEGTFVGPFWLGFYGFFFLSSGVFVFSSFFQHRSSDAKRYLSHLNARYVDADSKVQEILVVIGLVGFLFINDNIKLTDWITAVCAVLTLGSLFLVPKTNRVE